MNYTSDPVFQSIEQIRTYSAIEPILKEVWSHWLGKQAQSIRVKPILTYYRPFDEARIVAEVTAISEGETDPVLLHLFFHVFAEPAAARQELEWGYQQAIPPNAVLPVFPISDWQTVVWTLPHAPSLKELSKLLNPDYFCPLLIAPQDLPAAIEECPPPQLFRYVPFKRAILTWQNPATDRAYFIKLCQETEFSRVVNNFHQIHVAAKDLSFVVPQPVAFDPTSRTFSMTALSGEQFTKVMCQTDPQSFMGVGRVLAELHHADLHPETRWTPEKEIRTCDRAMQEVKLALPHLSKSLDRAISQLTAAARDISFSTNHPIHANLFGDQILYSRDRIGIVDWDTLALGDPHYDIGRLIAHFVYLAGREQLGRRSVRTCVGALLQGYEAASDWKLDRHCLTWHIATQLLLRGKISSLRKLPLGWQEHLEFVVAEAEWLIEGCSEYVSLPSLNRYALSMS